MLYTSAHTFKHIPVFSFLSFYILYLVHLSFSFYFFVLVFFFFSKKVILRSPPLWNCVHKKLKNRDSFSILALAGRSPTRGKDRPCTKGISAAKSVHFVRCSGGPKKEEINIFFFRVRLWGRSPHDGSLKMSPTNNLEGKIGLDMREKCGERLF